MADSEKTSTYLSPPQRICRDILVVFGEFIALRMIENISEWIFITALILTGLGLATLESKYWIESKKEGLTNFLLTIFVIVNLGLVIYGFLFSIGKTPFSDGTYAKDQSQTLDPLNYPSFALESSAAHMRILDKFLNPPSLTLRFENIQMWIASGPTTAIHTGDNSPVETKNFAIVSTNGCGPNVGIKTGNNSPVTTEETTITAQNKAIETGDSSPVHMKGGAVTEYGCNETSPSK